MTNFYTGRVCDKHPELLGKRYSSEIGACVACERARNRAFAKANPAIVNEWSKAWQKRSPEKAATRAKRWRDANPEKVKTQQEARGASYYTDAARKSHYGVTPEQFKTMLADQDSKCAICGKPQTEQRLGVKKAMNIDHCHATGKLRGLLCGHCNKALGFFNDDVALLKSAIKYLRSYI